MATVDIWILDFMRDSQTRFTYGEGSKQGPVWSPDGNQIIFSSTGNLYQIQASGGGEAKLLFESSEEKDANCFSRDFRLLLFTSINPETRADLWVLPLEDEGKAYPLLKTKYNEFDGQFSPDMNWVAYTSDESGRNEVYVRRFSQGSGGVVSTDEEKHRISTQGGIGPRWRGDGRELYYRASNGDVIAVEIAPGTAFKIGASKTLFKAPVSIPKMAGSYISFYWDVSEDGSRFFLPTPVEEISPSPFNVIMNWTSLLEQ
jgi:Tol biopolymer transport system component